MNINSIILLVVSVVMISACGDSRRDSFVQSRCGKIATDANAYEQCEEMMIDFYEKNAR